MGILRDDCRLCGKEKTKFIKGRGLRCAECWAKKKRRNRKAPETERRNIQSKEIRRKNLKIEVLTYYGKQEPICVCCGEKHIEFLCIDHIEGGGSKHRKEVGSGSKFYLWLKKNNFPEGFRTLCHNCNAARGIFGYCPHEKNT